MKKILHFHPNAFYAQKFVTPLNNAEKEHGFLSKLVTETADRSSDHIINFSISFNPLKFIYRFLNLLTLLIRNKPNIVVVHNSSTALIPLLASRLLFIKHIIYFNHGIPFLAYRGVLRVLLFFLEKFNCILSKDIITVSYDMKSKFKSITRKKVIIIHKGSASGLDLENKKHKVNFLKKIINFNISDKIILYVGRPNKRKGFFDVLNMWNELYQDKNDFKLILLGISQSDIIKKTKIKAENIFPMGFVVDSEPYYQLADYLFMTSHHEGLSYTVLESFKYRTLVISNKIDGVSELVQHKFNGFLVKNNNKHGFLNFVKYCEKNKKLKENFLDRSIKVIKKYEREKFLQSYIAFLKSFN